jgi:hypothetical protein
MFLDESVEEALRVSELRKMSRSNMATIKTMVESLPEPTLFSLEPKKSLYQNEMNNMLEAQLHWLHTAVAGDLTVGEAIGRQVDGQSRFIRDSSAPGLHHVGDSGRIYGQHHVFIHSMHHSRIGEATRVRRCAAVELLLLIVSVIIWIPGARS